MTPYIILSFLSPFIVLSLARKLSFVDKPDGHLKRQVVPIPYVGGFSLLLVILISCPLFPQPAALALLTLLTLIGILDDIYQLSPQIRLLVQIPSFTLFLLYQYHLNPLIAVAAGFLSAIIVNAFNFIDIKDGLLLSYAIPLLLSFTAIFPISLELLNLTFLTLSALLSIFFLNRQPAICYMGDGGTYGLTTIVLLNLYSFVFTDSFVQLITSIVSQPLISALAGDLTTSILQYLSLLFVFSPSIFEFLFVTRTRQKLGLNIFHGSPHHSFILLQRRRSSSAYFPSLVAGFCPSLVFVLYTFNSNRVYTLSVTYFIAFLALFVWGYFRLISLTEK